LARLPTRSGKACISMHLPLTAAQELMRRKSATRALAQIAEFSSFHKLTETFQLLVVIPSKNLLC
jgi:hypothetical protein